jgi:hypothetical protein
MHKRTCPMHPWPQQEVTIVVDWETTPPVNIDSTSVIDVEGGIGPEWEDGELCTP